MIEPCVDGLVMMMVMYDGHDDVRSYSLLVLES